MGLLCKDKRHLADFLAGTQVQLNNSKRGWDKSPSLSIVFGLSSKTQWLSGLYYADFISFYSPTQLCGGGTTKSNSNELPISVPLSFLIIQPMLTSMKCYSIVYFYTLRKSTSNHVSFHLQPQNSILS